ncbi:MAG: tyrosine-type recombinase/integrase [Pyrinomonadaceae bacterium]
MIKVFLREKKLKHGKRGLYLDYYPPIFDRDTQKQTRREHLRLYVFEKPKSELEREHNKETRILAESIKSRRQLEVQAGSYGFAASDNRRKDFLDFFEKLANTKLRGSKSNYDNWRSVLQYLKEFTGDACRFGDVDEKFCKDFKDYLLDADRISQNSAAGYFDKFKSAVRQAFEDKLLPENPARKVKSIKTIETQREFLTLSELKKLAETPFRYDDLRRAALFSALTGLRYSDISKLIWSEIQTSDENGHYIRFRQKKTKATETLPISSEAFALLGEHGSPEERIFPGLDYWQCSYINEWTDRAGIDRKITFHSFRHTYATLQLTLGTDIYTLSRLLGHKNLQTTQIYAHIVDEKKREAVDRIKLDVFSNAEENE